MKTVQWPVQDALARTGTYFLQVVQMEKYNLTFFFFFLVLPSAFTLYIFLLDVPSFPTIVGIKVYSKKEW